MKDEYNWLLNFYLNLVAFLIVTQTFVKLPEEDKEIINKNILELQQIFERILPQVQGRQY